MQVHHKKVTFRGHVQGVGFRYQTLNVAKGFDVSGYVRNEADGSVTLEAEGDESEVTAFLTEVIEELQNYIRETEESSGAREPEFRGFRIT